MRLEQEMHALNSYSYYVRLIAVLVISIFIAACGDGKSTGEEVSDSAAVAAGAEIINGIVVAAEPTQIINDASIAGVDSNGNGVRDDVERLIASKSSSVAEYDLLFALAKSTQTVIMSVNQTEEDLIKFTKLVDCTSDGKNISNSQVMKAVVNNQARIAAFKAATSKFGGVAINVSDRCQ
jgi:hypothetical protein